MSGTAWIVRELELSHPFAVVPDALYRIDANVAILAPSKTNRLYEFKKHPAFILFLFLYLLINSIKIARQRI